MRLLLLSFAAIMAIAFWLWSAQRSSTVSEATCTAVVHDHFSSFNDLSEVLKNSCLWPIVSPMQADIRHLIETCKSIACAATMAGNYASMTPMGLLTISHELAVRRQTDNNKNFTCVYGELSSIEDQSMLAPLVEIPIEPDVPTQISFSDVVVLCRDPFTNIIYGTSFINFGANFKMKPDGLVEGFAQADEDHSSMAILAFRGVSHNQLLRQLPQTLDFLHRNGFISFAAFNQMRKSSNENLLTSLGGVTTNSINSSTTSWIWNAIKEKGCATFLNDDIQTETPFGKTARRHPDFHLHSRFFHIYNQKNFVRPPAFGHCMKDGRLNAEEYLEAWEAFSTIFNKTCHFSLTYFNEISAYDDSSIHAIDQSIVKALTRMKESGVFKTTNVVILSDGGNDRADVSKTETGSVESKQGVFMIRPANFYASRHPQRIATLKWNSNRLISNWDIYATLLDMSSSEGRFLRNNPAVEMSLLRQAVSRNRTCVEAGISSAMCLCAVPKTKYNIYNKIGYRGMLNETLKSVFSTLRCIESVEVLNKAAELEIFGTRIEFSSMIEFLDFRVRATSRSVKVRGSDLPKREWFEFVGRLRLDSVDYADVDLVGKLVLRNSSSNCQLDNFYRLCETCFYKLISGNR